jgi:AcrR family transcriptional regulator
MSTSTRRATYHHGDLRATLIALALEALERDGPEGLALRGLAAQAGVSGMAPYRHFADKAALLAVLARQGFAELGTELGAVDDAADPAKALVAFAMVYVGFASAHPGLFRLMFGGVPPTPDQGLAAEPATMRGLFTARLAQLVPPPDQEIALLACWSILHGLASLLVSGRIRGAPQPPADLALRLGEILMKGLLA